MRTSILGLGSNLKYYLYQEPIALNKGIEGLRGIILNELGMNPSSGDVFIFVSKSGNLIKLLHYERNIFTMYTRKIYRGRFIYPRHVEGNDVYMMDWMRLRRLLNGYVYNKKNYH